MLMPQCQPELWLPGDDTVSDLTEHVSAVTNHHSALESVAASTLREPDRNDTLDRPRTAPDSSGSSSARKRISKNPAPLALPKHVSNFPRRHRKAAASIDSSVPRQTIMKALVSRPPPSSQLAISSTIHSLLSSRHSEDGASRARRLSEAFSDLHLDNDTESSFTGRLAALNSPCFFHKRFDDAVNIERVLAELEEDEGLSHSKLVQTATGVREVSRQLQRTPIRRAVKNVMIVTKARDNDLVVLTRQLTEWLLSTPRYGSDVGVNVYVDAKLRRSKRFGADDLISNHPRFQSMLRYWTPDFCWRSPEKFDLVLTLGGDGTVLYTSWLFQRIVPPILSFSLGSLGFLTNFEYQRYEPTLNGLMGEAGMRVNLRMRFTCTVYRASQTANGPAVESEQFEVLNEVVIDRGPSPYVSNLELYGDNELLTVVQADGCIFSTPTGSTAYSLSAGGSLVHPDIPAILLTPICPHTLSFRPMLLRDSMALRVAIPRNSRATAYAAFDGKGRVELRQGDYVTIAASQYPFPTVVSRDLEWIDSISRTLRWNTRGATQKGWTRGSAFQPNGDDFAVVEDDEGKSEVEPEFDIDFDDEEMDARDSGYSAEGSSVGLDGGSPRGRMPPTGT
jgi:NAD+ kinase